MTSRVAVDTSVAVPLPLASHRSYAVMVEWPGCRAERPGLAETHSILTRLPGDARLDSQDAAILIAGRSSAPLVLGAELSLNLPRELVRLGIAGAALYDAMVALAAEGHSIPLATRDQRAKSTYDLVAVTLEIVA